MIRDKNRGGGRPNAKNVIGQDRPNVIRRSNGLGFGQAFPKLRDEPRMPKVAAVPLSTEVAFANVLGLTTLLRRYGPFKLFPFGSYMSPSESPTDDLPNFDAGIEHPDGGRLLPVVTQDADNGQVLMMAWINREAFEQTVRHGRATYYSRSRRGLWRKGDTSGHEQHIVEVRVDCDGDAILFRVRQRGAACHENYRSCFFRKIDSNDEGQRSWLVDGQKLSGSET